MENKQSFYRTFEEKLVKIAIDTMYNDYVGGEENHWLDHNERCFDFTEEQLINIIVNRLLKEKRYIWLDNGMVLEAKHIRFIGKARINELVDHRVKFRHNKEGWCWEK